MVTKSPMPELERERKSGDGRVQMISLLRDNNRSIQIGNVLLVRGGSEEKSTILMREGEDRTSDEDRDVLVVGKMKNRE